MNQSQLHLLLMNKHKRMQMAVELLGRKLTAQEVLDMGPLLRPLKRFMHQCKRIVERTSSNLVAMLKQNVPNLFQL